jgi:protein-L-isoaspartate O-methyltransferase
VTYRVIQWATGGVGRAAIEGVLDHPDLELAGCWVHSEAKDGQDVGTLVGRQAVGVRATRNIDDLLALDADCVLYSPTFADRSVIIRILQSHKNLVTPLGWFYPSVDERARIDAVCREAGVTLHGTGIHPGGITERFPLMISALSGSIVRVRAEEFSDIRSYGAPDVIRDWMLFGKTPEESRTSIMAEALGAGFRQSVRMVADTIGVDLDPELRTTHEMAVATDPIDSPIGLIEPGLVAAQRFRWEGLVDGEPVITAAVNWLMGDEHLDPAWGFGPDGEHFEVEVTGDPSCLLIFRKLHPVSFEAGLDRNPGIVATAMHCVNAVPYVCDADPGLRTYLDLPLVAGRAARSVRRDRVRAAEQADQWDARYSERDGARWSGRPNGRFLVEVAGLAPGRALDVGCGEGADAIWLARSGWTVTAIDISEVAVGRARAAAELTGAAVEWICGDALRMSFPAGSYALVSMQYPALPKAAGDDAVRALLDTVRSGGLLLAVFHDLDDEHREHMRSRGVDPADYIDADDLGRLLGDDFILERHTVEPRIDPPPDTAHIADLVLRARRL